MLAVTDKPVLGVHPAEFATLSGTSVRFSSSSYASPSSPKIHELRARYEALHTANSDIKSLGTALPMREVK